MQEKDFVLETDRLILKEISFNHISNLFLLFSDIEIIKHTEDQTVNSIAEINSIILNMQAHYQNKGFGKWAVIKKETNEFLGVCGLKQYEKYNKTALSYSFLKQHWGKGFATESSVAVLKYAFEKLNFKKIVAWSTAENIAGQVYFLGSPLFRQTIFLI